MSSHGYSFVLHVFYYVIVLFVRSHFDFDLIYRFMCHLILLVYIFSETAVNCRAGLGSKQDQSNDDFYEFITGGKETWKRSGNSLNHYLA